MDFASGNSGSQLFHAVVKTGPECLQEGAYCQMLGRKIAPIVYGLLPDGYVMEKLGKASKTADLLQKINIALTYHVWTRPSVNYDVTGQDYRDYHKKLGIEIPTWAIPTEFCMTHGDPTVSNAMTRGSHLVMCDPRPPRFYVPQCQEADMGRIIQSYFGWETIAYGEPFVDYELPSFMKYDRFRNKAAFWCAAAVMRIKNLELSKKRPQFHIINWCNTTRYLCQKIYGSQS